MESFVESEADRDTRALIVLSGLASLGGILFARLHGWPLWGMALAALAPMLPFLATKTLGIYRRDHLLALFTILVLTQGGHVIEHLAQMYQIHVLGLRGIAAQGIFGVFNIEWVHFAWNTWILVAVVVLVRGFRTNPWLWATLVAAVWHELEHVAIMIAYLTTGVAGTPGLLAHRGLIGGGFPLSRPDLHFLYNLIESIPLAAALGWQLASIRKAPTPHFITDLLPGPRPQR